ncbi:MAG TPA: prepilin-type N-terminal cleavage/methylation domain-containing protein [Fimbriimonadaceae bacterium]|nr:prepilin-type N-terminal cleavage/methylation domain-containing protein [Fimbriimonadaceae bacterium]
MNKKAFTLIELLVVIAIIAILAAILFPVFAQAKLQAKTSAGLSNMKQLATGNQLYYNDYDDNRMGRQSIDNQLCMSWKQASEAYRKNLQIFSDLVNPAAKYYDGFSDPAVRTVICPATSAPLNGLGQYARGYYWNNIFGGRGGGGYWDNGGFNLSQVAAPADVGDVTEAKEEFTDYGPFLTWTQNVDSETSWLGAAAPVTGLQWNGTNGKYGDKAMNVGYLDGHAKRTAFSSLCGKWIITGTNTVTNPNQETFWNFSVNDINALGSGWSWMVGAVENYCSSMPVQFR